MAVSSLYELKLSQRIFNGPRRSGTETDIESPHGSPLLEVQKFYNDFIMVPASGISKTRDLNVMG